MYSWMIYGMKIRLIFLQENKYNNKVKCITYNELKSIKGEVIINTTPVGMYPNTLESPVSKEIINNFNSVVDIIYNPLETEFLKYGRELNKVTCGGLMMLVVQAICAEEIWQERRIEKNGYTKYI